ncbi:MAG: hypothetical protein IKS54_08865 [Erysipelotrichaceae bacterium]|nr:hypothetical protein [Erysipelotrichaceae bacterium]
MKWLSFLILVAADVVYKVLADKVNPEVNPFASSIATYSMALLTATVLFFLTSRGTPLKAELSKLNIYSVILGFVISFYELGFILAYRNGFSVGLLSPLLSVAVMVIMAIIGVLFFKEKISMLNTIGLVIASIGVLMTIN